MNKKLGILGPSGTFTEMAAMKYMPDCEPFFYITITEIFEAIEKEEIKDNGEKKDNIGMSEDEDDEPEPDEPDVEPEPFPLEDKKISDDDDDDEEDDDDDDFFEKSDDSYEDEKLADDESYTVEEIEEEKPKEEATWESRDDEDIKLDIF